MRSERGGSGGTGRVAGGSALWRDIDAAAQSQDLGEAVMARIAPDASRFDRRSLLKAMAASLALAGLTGCSGEADEAALPYVEAPEGVLPGKPKWYASAVTLGGFAQPLLGKTYVGRPVKLEGNPNHPATEGASDLFLQAALLGLYDPERSQAPRRLGKTADWAALDKVLADQAAECDRNGGEGFRLLTGAVTSPTLARQISALTQRWPKARWHVGEPFDDDRRLEAARIVFGRPLAQHLLLDQAEVVVSLDDDFLGPGPHQAVNARRWATRRRAFQARQGASRLFVAEATPSLAGVMAERRLIAAPNRIAALASLLAGAVGITGIAAPAPTAQEKLWVDAAVEALRAHAGKSLILAGARHPPEIQALVLLANERIGALGATLRLTEPITVAPPDGGRSLEVLTADMAAGKVTRLAMIGVNPAYAAPADLGFRDALTKVGLRLHAGLHYDETASLCHWHVPLAHELESWSDARAVDGTASIVQPLVRPFYAVRSLHALIEQLSAGGGRDADLVRATWREHWGEAFDSRWRAALLKGIVAESAAPAVTPELVAHGVAVPDEASADGMALVFAPDPTLYDGRFAGNAWLQETPKPFSKVTWGNVIQIAPALAAQHGLENGDEVTLSLARASITGPVWIMPGQERQTLAVTFGYGRDRAGGVASGLGYDAFVLLRRDRPAWLAGVALTPTGKRLTLATTQAHQAMDGYDFVRTVDAADLEGRPAPDGESFYPQKPPSSPSWGMTIDLDLCIGCNACMVACVAENNVPVVGKDLVAQGRQMHWLRVDRYYEGDPEEPRSSFQPVPCMHCEQAPCEMGCPVNASVHSADGLNLQVYNRCIGTRTCSSFCPYKVRRFNWFDYTADDPEAMRAMRNPDVTVRSRGVMEKCTYCVQRISEARIDAEKEHRPIRDGEIRTACQQACPTQAIRFGDVTDPASDVSRHKAQPRNYTLLAEENTRPRTSYLARIGPTSPDGKGGPT